MDMRLHQWLTLALFPVCVAACSGSTQHLSAPSPRSSTSTASPTTPPVTTAAPTSTSVVTTSANPSTSSTPSIDSAIAVYAACTMPAAQQHPTVEPAAIDMACADNGFGVKDVHWTRWTAGSATGAGTTWYKDCRPNCAEGKIIYTPGVQVTLTRPVRGASGGLVWSQITLSTLPPGYSPGPQALPTHPI